MEEWLIPSIKMKEKVPISVVVVAKDEEKNIADCLESVSWADEIVVLDDFSSDRTVEIARKYTDKVFQRKWDVEETHRNYAYSLASNEWVLSLDADERASPELKHAIAEEFEKGPRYDFYDIPRRNYIGDYWLRYGGWYPARTPRLFKKGSFKYEKGRGYPRTYLSGKSGHLSGDILHYVFEDFGNYLTKLNNWTTNEAKKWIGLDKEIGLAKAFYMAWERFMKAYIQKRGYKDGFVGFMAATFAGFYQLVTYAKYWEIRKNTKFENKSTD